MNNHGPCIVCGGDHEKHPIVQMIEDTAVSYFGCNEVREYLTELLQYPNSREYAEKMLARHPASGLPAEPWLADNMSKALADLRAGRKP